MSWTVKKRFAALFATLVVTLGVCAGLVVSLASDAQEQLEIVQENMAGAVALGNANSAVWELRWELGLFLSDPSARQRIMDNEAKHRARLNDAFKVYGALKITPEEREGLEQLKTNLGKYMDARPKWFQLMNEG
jgi:hypothetical protein